EVRRSRGESTRCRLRGVDQGLIRLVEAQLARESITGRFLASVQPMAPLSNPLDRSDLSSRGCKMNKTLLAAAVVAAAALAPGMASAAIEEFQFNSADIT